MAPGASFFFDLTVENAGGEASDVSLVDELPSGLTATAADNNACGISAVGGLGLKKGLAAFACCTRLQAPTRCADTCPLASSLPSLRPCRTLPQSPAPGPPWRPAPLAPCASL